MYYLFYGDDTFQIKEKTDLLIKRFLDDQKTDMNLSYLDSKDLTFDSFFKAVFSLPFLGQKRLTVIFDPLSGIADKSLAEKIRQKLPLIPSFSTVLFIERDKFDKRSSFFKTLNKKGKSFLFEPLSGYLINKKIEDLFFQYDFKISKEAIYLLAMSVGSDLWRLKNEILKIINYAKSQKRIEVGKEDILLLVQAEDNSKVFDLTDAISEKNLKKSLQVLSSLMKKKEEPLILFNMLVTQVRNMLILSDFGSSNQSEIAKETKIHPFVVKKTLSSLKNFSFEKLAQYYRILEDFDYRIKNGLIDTDLALNLLVVEFCKR